MCRIGGLFRLGYEFGFEFVNPGRHFLPLFSRILYRVGGVNKGREIMDQVSLRPNRAQRELQDRFAKGLLRAQSQRILIVGSCHYANLDLGLVRELRGPKVGRGSNAGEEAINVFLGCRDQFDLGLQRRV
ncbi:MAG: hypothetical protein V3S24_09670 [Candidatus Tectomicrobia bacterium]